MKYFIILKWKWRRLLVSVHRRPAPFVFGPVTLEELGITREEYESMRPTKATAGKKGIIK